MKSKKAPPKLKVTKTDILTSMLIQRHVVKVEHGEKVFYLNVQTENGRITSYEGSTGSDRRRLNYLTFGEMDRVKESIQSKFPIVPLAMQKL